MTRTTEPDTDELLERSAAGDRSARGPLLQRHRDQAAVKSRALRAMQRLRALLANEPSGGGQ
jgi:hypothetical protein